MAFGDIARTDEYGDDLADPFAAAAYRQQRRYLGRNVVGSPEEQRGSPPLWNPVDISPVQRSANEMLLQQPLWNEPQMRKPVEALRHTAEAMAFPTEYSRVGTDINPKNLITPNVLTEEDLFRADDMKRRGLNWGAKTGTAVVGDPVPGLVALAHGQSLRGSMGSVGAGAGPFYSTVERTVAGSPLKQASAAQWAGTIRNAPGVKPAELEQLGLEPWLGQQQGAVPKQALADYVAANKVNVGEVRKGLPDFDKIVAIETERAAVRRNLDAVRQQIANPETRDIALTRARGLGNLDQTLTNQISAAHNVPTKFSQYQLPGGENYRETLLTLPTQREISFNDFLASYRNRFPGAKQTDAEIRGFYDRGIQIPGQGKTISQPDKSVFLGTHWDEPNVLAHYRTNDRIIGGKKTLFGEEVQSDWLQLMRKKEQYAKLAADLERSGPGEPGYRDLLNKHWQLGATLGRYKDSPIPSAPFQSNWHELAMKRMVRDAAEGGYEQLAWTPGVVQNKRFPDPARSDAAMEGFYDKMLPAAANKIGKPYGAQVRQERLLTEGPSYGQNLDQATEEALQAIIDRMGGTRGPQEYAVHTLPITPQLREQALRKGFPMYAVPGAIGLGALADPSRYKFPEEQYQ